MIRVAFLFVAGKKDEERSKCQKIINERLKKIDGSEVYNESVVPEFRKIQEKLFNLTEKGTADVIFTVGGIGFEKDDITPEATMAVIEKETCGLAELMRRKMAEIIPEAVLSRGRAGIRKTTLIINFPAGFKAVNICLDALLPVLPHGIEILRQIPGRNNSLKLWDK